MDDHQFLLMFLNTLLNKTAEDRQLARKDGSSGRGYIHERERDEIVYQIYKTDFRKGTNTPVAPAT